MCLFLLFNMTNITKKVFKQNKWKRCSMKKCCKQCGQVKFMGTMTKWPVQKHTEHHKTRRIQRRNRHWNPNRHSCQARRMNFLGVAPDNSQFTCWVPCLCGCCKMSYYIIVLLIFSGPQGSWSAHVCCLHLKMEFRSCARGCQWCGIIHYQWWTASISLKRF